MKKTREEMMKEVIEKYGHEARETITFCDVATDRSIAYGCVQILYIILVKLN